MRQVAAFFLLLFLQGCTFSDIHTVATFIHDEGKMIGKALTKPSYEPIQEAEPSERINLDEAEWTERYTPVSEGDRIIGATDSEGHYYRLINIKVIDGQNVYILSRSEPQKQ